MDILTYLRLISFTLNLIFVRFLISDLISACHKLTSRRNGVK